MRKLVAPGGRHHGLAVPVGQALDARVGLHQEARAGVEVVDRKRHLLGAVAVVGGAAALQVDGAVLQQRDAVGRGHGLALYLQVGAAGRLLDLVDDALADVDAEARRLGLVVEVGKGDRRFAVGQRDAAAGLHLVQRRLRPAGRAGHAGQAGQQGEQGAEGKGRGCLLRGCGVGEDAERPDARSGVSGPPLPAGVSPDAPGWGCAPKKRPPRLAPGRLDWGSCPAEEIDRHSKVPVLPQQAVCQPWCRGWCSRR